jgi:hypothetical protein
MERMSVERVKLGDVHWIYFYRWAREKSLTEVGRVIGTAVPNVANIVRRTGRNVLDDHLDAIAIAKGEGMIDQLSAFLKIGAELAAHPNLVAELETEARETRYSRGRPRAAGELAGGSAARFTPGLAEAIERRRRATNSAKSSKASKRTTADEARDHRQ